MIKGVLGLLAVFAVVTAIAWVLGAANLGTAATFGQIAFAAALVWVAQALTRCGALRDGSRSTREPAPPSATLARAVTR